MKYIVTFVLYTGCWGDQTAAKDWSEKDVGTNWNAKAGTGATQWGNGWVNRNKVGSTR